MIYHVIYQFETVYVQHTCATVQLQRTVAPASAQPSTDQISIFIPCDIPCDIPVCETSCDIPGCDISCDIVSDIPGSRGTEIQPNARPPPLCCRTSASCSATRRRRRTTARTHGSAKHISQEHCNPSRIEEALGSPRA